MKDHHLGFCVQQSVHVIDHTGVLDKVLPSIQGYSYVQVIS